MRELKPQIAPPRHTSPNGFGVEDSFPALRNTWPSWKADELTAVIYAVSSPREHVKSIEEQLSHAAKITAGFVERSSKFLSFEDIPYAKRLNKDYKPPAAILGNFILGAQPEFNEDIEVDLGLRAKQLHTAHDKFEAPFFADLLELAAQRGATVTFDETNRCLEWPRRYREAIALLKGGAAQK